MKKISILLASTILSSIAAPAQAAPAKEPGVYFHPAKNWVVGKASEADTVCAVQSEFNNGFILQFDGEGENVKSFSINFRQNIFNENQNYDVALGVPGKEKKTFSATATGPSILTIPMQDDKSFYNAAREAVAVDVAIDQNSFRFYLVNFPQAANNFENCMAGKPPAVIQGQPMQASAPTMEAAPMESVQIEATLPEPGDGEEIILADAAQAQNTPALPAPTIATQRERDAMSNIGTVAPPPPPVDENAVDKMNEAIALEEQEKTGTVPVQEIIPEAEKTKAAKRPTYHKRMSEMLDEEIRNDPSIASPEDDAPKHVSPDLGAQPVQDLLQDAPAESVSNEKPVAVPPTVEEPAIKTVVPARPIPVAPVPVETTKPALIQRLPAVSGDKSADELNAAVLQNRRAFSAASVTPVPAQATPAPSPIAVKSEAEALAAQVPQAGSDEPFSKRGVFIDTDAPASMQPDYPKSDTGKQMPQARSGEPTLPMPEDVKNEPAQSGHAMIEPAAVKNYKTPDMIVHREESQLIKADFTATKDYASAEPFQQFASNDPNRIGDMKADPEMLMKISQLEKEVNKLRKENDSVRSELENTVKGAEAEKMSISSENWNLESATMRYNEAERQIKRLGEQLAKERAACSGEKKDLEAQLFDPRITDQQQLARLAELEKRLEIAQQQLQMERDRRGIPNNNPPVTGMQ